jgi:NitT/TauT family transport system substrate-binding protein
MTSSGPASPRLPRSRSGAGRSVVLGLVVLLLASVGLAPGLAVAQSTQSPGPGADATPTSGGSVASATADATAQRTPLTVGLGYIPSVQFAQFYLADQAGYYADAGLDVTFQHNTDVDLITLIGQGAVDIGLGDGTSLIPAVSQGIPVVYVATVFARFPNVLFSLKDSGIQSAADLAGRSVGIPGRFGSSWVALQALLASADLTPDDVRIVTYPDFGHGVAVAEGQVDAAVGYLNNEPVVLTREGRDVNVIRIDEVAPLPGPGLIVGRSALEAKGDALRAFTAATLRAMEDIVADPQRGLDATLARVPELAADPELQLAILQATADAWQSDFTRVNGLGSIDRAAWQSAVDIMTGLPDWSGATPPQVDQLVTDELLP